ncbi:hypothetical protein LA76x_2600 [Lysobacter antibioticus]|uniref:Uncharacterized protein n=1 Tax=Lysobacter antibioticus TaxID=84531 RepID=A0A0S2FB26_LYSAN|nr:hypothetical protein LA76x_2600 [Lysobacter antibioticus]
MFGARSMAYAGSRVGHVAVMRHAQGINAALAYSMAVDRSRPRRSPDA